MKPMVKNPIKCIEQKEGSKIRKRKEKKKRLAERRAKQIAIEKQKGTYQKPGLVETLTTKLKGGLS